MAYVGNYDMQQCLETKNVDTIKFWKLNKDMECKIFLTKYRRVESVLDSNLWVIYVDKIYSKFDQNCVKPRKWEEHDLQ